jgi:hypothetical protein
VKPYLNLPEGYAFLLDPDCPELSCPDGERIAFSADYLTTEVELAAVRHARKRSLPPVWRVFEDVLDHAVLTPGERERWRARFGQALLLDHVRSEEPSIFDRLRCRARRVLRRLAARGIGGAT